jgi:hypothetical protein
MNLWGIVMWKIMSFELSPETITLKSHEVVFLKVCEKWKFGESFVLIYFDIIVK